MDRNSFMYWINIENHGIPEGEVLAANFESGTDGYCKKMIGKISNQDGVVICDNGHDKLQNITHFIYIHNWDL